MSIVIKNGFDDDNNVILASDRESHKYHEAIEGVIETFKHNYVHTDCLFTTTAQNLFAVYLSAIPSVYRQFYTCTTCRHFFERFGGLATITEKGEIVSAFWNPENVNDFFKPAVKALKKTVERSDITGVFRSDTVILGQPVTGNWTHFHGKIPKSDVYQNSVKSVGQHIANKAEHFGMVDRGLKEFDLNQLDTSLKVLTYQNMDVSGKFRAPVDWLIKLHTNINSYMKSSSKRRDNIIWKAVASAPEGFCHPRTSVVSTLLEDIEKGLPFETVKKNWSIKTNGINYQRPKAAPAAGTIIEAERLVDKLGIRDSLDRRHANADELEYVWQSTFKSRPVSGGVFLHIQPKNRVYNNSMSVLPQTMTWVKFVKEILPNADEIFLQAPSVGQYSAIVTENIPGSPKLFKWDNPFSSYVYHNGSSPHHWNISSHAYYKILGICLPPRIWGKGIELKEANDAILIVEGMRETRHSGLAIFPEDVRSELHAVRSVIEAYSNKGVLKNRLHGNACGIRIKGNNPFKLKVKVDNFEIVYTIDRFD